MLMVDVRRPGRQVFQALLEQKVVIGRTWPSMPNHVRISIGTREEMAQVSGGLRARHECLSCWAGEQGGAARAMAGADLAGDASGGAIAALVALPYGLALARLMGLPPELGLFTSILTAPLLSLLGRNPVLIGGTASATVPFIAAAVSLHGPGGAAKICIAAAVFMMIFCVLRLGRHVAKVPHAVVSGFSCGVGAMMVILQLRTLLGLPSLPGDAPSPVRQLIKVVAELADTRWEPLLLGLIVIVAAWAQRGAGRGRPAPCRRRPGRRRRLSFRLARAAARRVVAQLASVRRLHLGADRRDRRPAGRAGAGVRHLGQHPDHVAGGRALSGPAPAPPRGRRRRRAGRLRNRQPLRGRVRGTHERRHSGPQPGQSSAAGERRDCRTSCTPLFLLVLVALGSGVIARIPLAALAGVTAYVGLSLLEWSTWRRLHRMRRLDAAAFLATAAAVLTTNAVAAVAIGCTPTSPATSPARLPSSNSSRPSDHARPSRPEPRET